MYLDTFDIAFFYPSQNFIYGGLKMNGITESFVQSSDFWKFYFDLGPSDLVPKELKPMESLNWFEQQSYSDDGRFGCFQRQEGLFPPPIIFFDKGWITAMDLSITEYFNALFDSCGVKGWQYFYIDWNQEVPYKEEAIIDMKKAVEILPQLFPQMDFSYHKQRLSEIL